VKAGDKKEINFKYPDDHKDERYRGKTAKFNVEITDVREIVPPTFDEEFCKQIGVKDKEELQNNVTESLANRKREAAKAKAVDEAIEKLIAQNPFEVPHARIVDLIKWSINRNVQDPKDAVEPTEEQINSLSAEAVREIKKHRILDFIATKEKLKASQEAVDERIKQMALAYQIDFESLKGHLRQSGRINSLREELRIQLAADFIVGIRPAAESK
jgi:trigger factor